MSRPGSVQVEVRVGGLTWSVPRGFGAAYREMFRFHADECDGPLDVAKRIQSALGLIGYDVATAAISRWTTRQRVEAHVYAWREHMAASDNPVQRHHRPAWLPEPWRGLNGSATEVTS